jgi:hypothetical protein
VAVFATSASAIVKASCRWTRNDVDLHDTPNMNDLRRALGVLIDTAQGVEEKVVLASLNKPEVA